MHTGTRPTKPVLCAVVILLYAGMIHADNTRTAYPAMAPIEAYREASASAEIALARSAGPTSISADASILTLGKQGYETAITGQNGFVCLVERSWGAGFDDPEFWNPKIRAPICFNPAAARTVLPIYVKRTEWVIAGASKADMSDRSRAEVTANRVVTPEPGAMSFMMSKPGYLGDRAGHWHPHLMFFLAHASAADWGANLQGSPVFAAPDGTDPFMTFFVPVPAWSDGTQAVMETH